MTSIGSTEMQGRDGACATASSASPSCDVLQNQVNFPSFSNLPHENDVDLKYYRETSSGVTVFCRCRTWYFLAEITNDELAPFAFLRRRILVKDREDQDNIPIAFYPEFGCFNYEVLKNGWTVIVMCAEQHNFLDLTVGLRVEDLDSIRVIKCGLNDIFALSTHCSKSKGSCWGCGKKPAAETLKKCGACKEATYCNRDCQVNDWKSRHKKWCKVLPDFLKLSSVKYNKAEPHAYWK